MFSLNPESALNSLGYVAVGLFVGIESLGVPLPGETILITAAAYAGATHALDIRVVIAVAAIAGIIGDNIGFTIGWFGGFALLRRYGKYVRLDETKLKVGRYVFMRGGVPVVFFGRFVSILRTYAAFLAGVNHMHWRYFVVANAAGAVCWSVAYGVAAYFLGNRVLELSRPYQIAIGAGAAVFLIATILVVRARAKRLESEAEAAFPGPLT